MKLKESQLRRIIKETLNSYENDELRSAAFSAMSELMDKLSTHAPHIDQTEVYHKLWPVIREIYGLE